MFVETNELTRAGKPSARVELYARREHGTVTVRLHANDDDTARKFNRTENVRPIAPDDPGFTELFRRRNDAESINRALEDTLLLRRAHSIGHQRQHLILITYALTVNSLAIHRHGHRSGDPPDQLAA